MEAEKLCAIFKRHPIPMWLHDRETLSFIEVNEQLLMDLGYTRDEFMGMKLGDLFPQKEPALLSLNVEPAQPPGLLTVPQHLCCKDGRLLRANLICDTLEYKDHDAVMVTLHFPHEETLQRRSLEARLRINEFAYSHSLDELLQKTLDEAEALTESAIGFFHFIEEDQVTVHLQNWSTNTLKNMCTAEGKNSHYRVDQAGVWVDCVRERRPVIYNDYASLTNKKGLPPGHALLTGILTVPILRDGKIVAILGVGNKAAPYDDLDAKAVQLLADLAWDIAVVKRAQERIRYMAFVMSKISQAVISTDADLRVTQWNEAAELLYGWTEAEALGRRVDEVCGTEYAGNQQLEMRAALMTHKKWQGELKQHHRNGTALWISASLTLLEDDNGKIIGGVTINHDITKRKHAEDDLIRAKNAIEEINTVLQRAFEREQLASRTDGLTGIFNRRYFYELIEYEFSASVRYKRPLSLIMFDIDHFKEINDQWGHLVGDEVLKRLAQIVHGQLRETDMLARYGGDEFVILLPNSDSQESLLVFQRVLAALQSSQINPDGRHIPVFLSAGIASLEQGVVTPSRLVHLADQALYSAKQAGRNRVRVLPHNNAHNP